MNTNVKKFETYFVATLALISGIIIIYLAIIGPLFLNQIHYKTSSAAIIQMEGQDIANLLFLSPLLLIGGILLLYQHRLSKYFLIITPLSVIYYALSYILGLEWASSLFTGNSEDYFYFFLFLIVSSLIIMLYTLPQFKGEYQLEVRKRNLIIYSVIFTIAILVFAKMWMGQVNEVIQMGTTVSYDETPTVFWVIRTFDLGFVIPIGLISLYLLWNHLNHSLALQYLFYGFFITMGLAVNAMGLLQAIKEDPAYSLSGQFVFVALLLIATFGFLYILRNVKKSQKKSNTI